MRNINLNDQSEIYSNDSVLVETANDKYLLSEPVSKKEMYELMLNLLEQEYFKSDQLTSPHITSKDNTVPSIKNGNLPE